MLKLASNNEVKTLSAMPALPCEAKLFDEAILASPTTKKKAFKAKPRAFQAKNTNNQSPRVSRLDRLNSINTELRDYLSKHCLEESVSISPPSVDT